jgi:hypothetical protein
MSGPPVFVVLIVLIVLLMPVVIVWVRRHDHEAKAGLRERLAEYERAGLQVTRRLLRWYVISGEHAGVPFEHHFVPADKNVLGRAVVSIPTSAPGEFHVRPETGGTEVIKQMGMVKEFQTGDVSFDRKYYFSGSSDEYVRAVFGAMENLEQLRVLFARGANQLEKRGTMIIATKPGADLLELTELRAIVEQLRKFRLPTTIPEAQGKGFPDRQVLYALRAAMLALALIGAAGFFIVSPLLDGWMDFAVRELPLLVLLCAAMLAAAYFGLKGRSMAVRGMIELLICMPALALVGTLALANQEFDGAKVEEHEVRLTKRYMERNKSKGGREILHFHVHFESWRGRIPEMFEVSADIYNLAHEGDIWRFRTGSGLLGHAWIESMAPANKAIAPR